MDEDKLILETLKKIIAIGDPVICLEGEIVHRDIIIRNFRNHIVTTYYVISKNSLAYNKEHGLICDIDDCEDIDVDINDLEKWEKIIK